MPWLSAHVFCDPPWEGLLVGGVRPFVERQLRTGSLRSYFFIRYFERGPHVRVRLQHEPSQIDMLTIGMEAVAREHFRARPSPSRGRPRPASVCSVDSLRWIEYEPEYERYGGPVGVEIAERHFFASSEAVLAALSCRSAWSPGSRFELGLQLAVGLLAALGLEPGEFANSLDAVWRGLTRMGAAGGELDGAADTLGRCKRTFAALGATFSRSAAALWRAADCGAEFLEEWFAAWVCAAATTRCDLLDAIERGALTLTANCARRVPHTLAISYLHMMLNRIGVLGAQEVAFTYCLMRALSEIAGFSGDE